MKITAVLVALTLTLKIEKLLGASDVLLPGGKTALFPVKVAPIHPQHDYTIKLICESENYDLNTCSRETSLKGASLDEYLGNEKLTLPFVAKGSIKVVLQVTELPSMHHDTITYTLKSPEHIPLEVLHKECSSSEKEPLTIATVPAPFDTLELEVEQLPTSNNGSITVDQGKVILQRNPAVVTGEREYTIKDKNSALSSQPHKLTVKPQAVSKKRRLIIIGISVGAAVLVFVLIAVVMQLKFRPFGLRKKQQLDTMKAVDLVGRTFQQNTSAAHSPV